MVLTSVFLFHGLLEVMHWKNKICLHITFFMKLSIWSINWDAKCEIDLCCVHKPRKRKRKANISMFVRLYKSEHTLIISWSGHINSSIHCYLKLLFLPEEFIKMGILMFFRNCLTMLTWGRGEERCQLALIAQIISK